VKTPAFGLADRLMADKGMSSQQATLMGLSAVMTGLRQGIEIPKMGPTDKAMGMLDRGMMGTFYQGFMQSGGGLDRAAASAMADPNYALEVQRQKSVTGAEIFDLQYGRAQQAQERAAASAETGRQLSQNFGIVGTAASYPVAPWQWLSMNQDQQWQKARAQNEAQRVSVNVSVRSDDPAVSVMGSSD
jgi:hypothetical protein